MNEKEERKREEELKEKETPMRWLYRYFHRRTIKRICEILRKLEPFEPQEAIKFLEKELRIAERHREAEFWYLYYDTKYVRFLRRQIERLQRKIKERKK